MCGKLCPLFVIVLVCSISAAAQVVVESESTFSIRENYAVVNLAVKNGSDISRVSQSVELIDIDGVRKAGTTSGKLLEINGKKMLEFRLPIAELGNSISEDLAWYRLRYRVGDSTGIISMSQMLHDLFELRIIAADNILSGMTYRVRVRALSPFTEKPAANVKIETAIELELQGEDKQVLNFVGSGETDVDGFAVVDFRIPPETKLDGDGEVQVVGRKNGIIREAKEDINALKQDLQFLMMTDKPIYQPEQTLNIRGILFKGGESKTVLNNSEIEFRIEDEDDTLLYREKVLSSVFGVAAVAWRIPANAKLGDYRIEVRGENGEQIGGNRVKVSRYDLPNFVVNTKSSKPYYLPEDREAEIEIHGDYLFGKPVTRGRVRVVEETSREWNYKEQKYETDEGEVREGETNADGKFIARFELKEKHEDLKEDDWRKHRDIRYAAYFTDLTTNKTEQRRFDIRVSREPIHVYLIRTEYDNNPQLPVIGYVSTFYADGTPAECEVDLKASEENEGKFKTYARLKTNAHGAAKFSISRPKIGDPDDDLDFVVVAKDKAGRRGTSRTETMNFDEDEQVIQIATDRAIYKPGERINVSLRSTVKSGTVYLDVVNGWTVIDSYFLKLANGGAELKIPYSDAFKGELKIAAFVEDREDDDELIRASRGVIFPTRQGINVDASFDKAVYKPNEEATVKYRVLDAVGGAIESALGVVIIDKAVEERARTNAEFGGMFQGLGSWLGYGSSFGGINVKDLNELDLSKPISPEMQLVAEVILHDSYYYPNLFHSDRYYDQAKSVFGAGIAKQLQPLANALASAYKERGYLHATDDESLRKILSLYSVNLNEFRDPWGVPYKSNFSINKTQDIVSIISAGPDKQFETRDDFTAYSAPFEYFTPMGKAIDTAVKNYHERTDRFIWDENALFDAVGIRELKDRFGRPYRITFEADGPFLQLRIRSGGRDRKFEQYEWSGDDFQVWSNRQDYFSPVERKIKDAQNAVKNVPMTEAEFRGQLKAAGINDEMLRDGSGRPLYLNAEQTSRYWDRVTIETVQVYGETKRVEKRVVTPVTQQIMRFTIRGTGKDGKSGTYDDVTFMQVVHVLSEQAKDDPKPVPVIQQINYSANTGSIAGVVTDANGAIVAGATVTATNDATSISRTTSTNDSGSYLITNLAEGTHRIKVAANGFKDTVMTGIPVKANATAQANIVLEAGTVSETVDVSAGAEATSTTNATIGSTVTSSQIAILPLNTESALKLARFQPCTTATDQEKSTPRLREYFPETLLWRPEVVTDSNGNAEVKFRMADNITTWKMYTIASTKNGKVGFAEKEVTAFQSFFVDLDPPKFLTNGDEIFLPTQVRNYTDKMQKVGVSMAKTDWFSFLGCDGARAGARTLLSASVACDADSQKQKIDVAAGDTQNAVFGFKAVTPIKDGKQRVTAIAETDSDAIERPVTVRPDGREIVATESRYFTGSDRIDVNFPANALSKTQTAELKIYPNLMAHVAESVEGLLQRPYGCGEQTISSTYPNLMILKFTGSGDRRRIAEKIEQQARKNLQSGYERLLGYQVSDGGFSYWGAKDESDLAVTAYALRFLADASAFIAVDQDAVNKAEDWLVKQQRTDGSWNKKYRWEQKEDDTRAKRTTTYIARTLAMLRSQNAEARASARAISGATLEKALKYLKFRNAEIDDPYSLALFGLAAFDAGDRELAEHIGQSLVAMGKDESGGVYWNLESNTAFNGWGFTGRIETTALVTQLLMKLNEERNKPIIGKAMMFLLKNKDRYGVWYSTQTTINVLDTFVASLAADSSTYSQSVEIFLNGAPIKTVEIGSDKLDQIVVDLNGKLASTQNNIELRSSNKAPLMAQVVSNHYIGWQDADSAGRAVNQSRALQFEYKCDRTEANILQDVSCSVSAERIGFRGYGMLLAEIGTPPGADVSRESLEAALENDWSISKYEVLPDRIRLYMWSKAGGTKLNFKFRPRYGINAQTPASVVYDYYNPEAQAVSPPLQFVVR
ncbi:MAG: alpha-2-macroglobulin family protein [Pyrinomonadaceae bacterium]